MAQPDEPLHLRPAARLQRYLGRELIADPNVAIIEFVKNSYDAGAGNVFISFALESSPTSVTLADDGVGMTLRSFRTNWMRPGFSSKGTRTQPEEPPKDATPAQIREAERVPVGEKGIGRLAAGRLGEQLDVFTRRAASQPWLHVHFSWQDFDTMEKAIDEIPIAHDYTTEPPESGIETGTILVISDLSERWWERVRGRAVRGRRRTKLGRLKQDLEFLVAPLSPTQREFEIALSSDRIQDPDDVGTITPASALRESGYSYAFEFKVVDGRASISRSVTRSAEAASLASKKRQEALPAVTLGGPTSKQEDRPADLLTGPFEGVFVYNPPPARQRAKQIEESPAGVLLYRDGLLVEPYGIGEDDWLGARARKAQRQGHAAIQPDTFSGHVLITKHNNRELRDQTNRLGLLDTAATENFLEHLRAEFRQFETLIYNEVLEQRWETSREQKATDRARESLELSRIQLRALAHGLRQPLQALGFEVIALEQVRDDPTLPAPLRDRIDGIASRVTTQVAKAEQLVAPLLEWTVPEFADTPVARIVEAVVDQTKQLADHHGTDLEVNLTSRDDVLVPVDLVVQAIASLVVNAIEAPRSPEARPSILLAAQRSNGNVLISVADNGTGIPGATPETPLDSIKSTKGRPHYGLQGADRAVAAVGGRLRLVKTDSTGTTIEILLPTRVAGLRN